MIVNNLNPWIFTSITKLLLTAAPGMDDQRDLMRASAKKKEGQRHALPPQIFNGEKYCGDYDDFDVANEDDELEEFLGIPRKTPKVNNSYLSCLKCFHIRNHRQLIRHNHRITNRIV